MRLGLTNEYGKYVPLHVRRDNFSVFGQTQFGKSTLLTAYVLNDVYAGKNLTVIGDDAVEEILKHIPRWRQEDVVYFNPAIQSLGFNPLFKVPRSSIYARAESIVDTILTLLSYEGSTPVMKDFIRLSTQTLLKISTETASLLSVYYFLTDESFRDQAMGSLHDPTLKYHWDRFNSYTPKEQRDEVRSTLNKLSDYLFNPMLRDCLVQRANHLDFNNKIVLVSLNAEAIGSSGASFMGALVLATMHSQKDIRTNLYIDDASRFGHQIISDVLGKSGITTVLTARSPHDFTNFNEISKHSSFITMRVTDKDKKLLNEYHSLPAGAIQLHKQTKGRAYVYLRSLELGSSPVELWFTPHNAERPPRNTRRGHKRVEKSIIDRCWKMYTEPRDIIRERVESFTKRNGDMRDE